MPRSRFLATVVVTLALAAGVVAAQEPPAPSQRPAAEEQQPPAEAPQPPAEPPRPEAEPPGRGHAGENVVLRLHAARLDLRGEGDYWPDKETEFTKTADDFQDLAYGVDLQQIFNGYLSLMFSLGYYSTEEQQAYIGFTDRRGNPITHLTRLERAELTAGLLVHPLGRDGLVAPYLGGGFSGYLWRLRERGDFLNFTTTPPSTVFQELNDEREATGHYWLVGVEVPIFRHLAAFAEVRWEIVEQELGDDFLGFGDLDLSSREVGAGLSVSY